MNHITSVIYIISCLMAAAACISVIGLAAYVSRGYFALGGESLLMLGVIGYMIYQIYLKCSS